MGFWKDRFVDIRGNLLWQILVWACGGGVVTAATALVQFVRHQQPTWHMAILVFVISTLGLGMVFLLASRHSPAAQQPATAPAAPLVQGAITLSALLGKPQQMPNFDAALYFRIAHHSPVTAEVEKNMGLIAKNSSPNDEVGFLCRFIGVGLVAYLHDIAWAYIYKSQLLMLQELNRRNGLMPAADAKKFYDQAVAAFPKAYANYQFNQWLGFLIQHQLLLQHPSQMLEITFKGKDFLKYLTHWGADLNIKPN